MLYATNPSHILSFVLAFKLAVLNGFFFQIMHITVDAVSLQQTDVSLFLPPTHTFSDVPFQPTTRVLKTISTHKNHLI